MNSPSQSAQGQRANVPAPQVSAVALVSVNKPQKDLNCKYFLWEILLGFTYMN
jgi:hypothetical protein